MAAISLSNGKTWGSLKAAKAHFKGILHAYANGEVVIDPDHHADLKALVTRLDAVLPVNERKGVAGIARFERRLNSGQGYATPGFWLVRPDGTATDFSYIVAVEGRRKPQSLELSDACRRAVASDLASFMRARYDAVGAPTISCPLTGALVLASEAHVDHDEPSFASIVLGFRRTQGWAEVVPPGVLTTGADAQTSTMFADQAIAAQFREFHNRYARLRVVSAKANLARAGGQRRPSAHIE